jgi:hypothetical protein
MDSYTLLFLREQHGRPTQILIPKHWVRPFVGFLGVLLVIAAGLGWDYWRLRADNAELAALRVEATERREQVSQLRDRIAEVDRQIGEVVELERKVRIIANLPGSAGVGGEGVSELVPEGAELSPPAGVPVERPTGPAELNGQGGGQPFPQDSTQAPSLLMLEGLDGQALALAADASLRASALVGLLEQLEEKRHRLVSMPSIWPAKGWLTSRYGPRVSPFTGRRQLHAGIDIAAASGTSIYAPARARVTFVGRKGPLGKTLVLDHGFGVKTFYGHTKEIHVTTGETVERGQEIAAIGSTGRSTGPHLHYVVEVDGKTRDPLDYIFD